MNPQHLLFSILLAIIISFLAYRAHALNKSGAVAAAVLGSVVFGIGGLPAALVLMVFFITSSGLSRLFRQRKKRYDEKFSKGSQRDAGQVFANGGIAGLCLLASLIIPNGSIIWLAYCGSLAAVNADTWATELGVLNRSQPRLITNGQPVEAGTSGAISPTGSLAAASGSLLIALIGILALSIQPLSSTLLIIPPPTSAVWILIALGGVTFAGILGSLVDSWLGATYQAIYTCPTCQKETERHPLHSCGTPTQKVRGWRWLNNDWVNTACALIGAILGCLVGFLLSSWR